MPTYTYELIDAVVNVLEDNAYDPLPSTERTGSMWFKEEQEIVFNRQMPKGKVFFDSIIPSDRSMGASFNTTKTYLLNVVFFTRKADKDPSSGKKDREFVEYMLQNIEDTLKSNQLGVASLSGFGEVNGPIEYDKENNIFIGVLPVLYKLRE